MLTKHILLILCGPVYLLYDQRYKSVIKHMGGGTYLWMAWTALVLHLNVLEQEVSITSKAIACSEYHCNYDCVSDVNTLFMTITTVKMTRAYLFIFRYVKIMFSIVVSTIFFACIAIDILFGTEEKPNFRHWKHYNLKWATTEAIELCLNRTKQYVYIDVIMYANISTYLSIIELWEKMQNGMYNI